MNRFLGKKEVHTLWQNLLLKLNKTLPNHFSIPFPNHARGTHPIPGMGYHSLLKLIQVPDDF